MKVGEEVENDNLKKRGRPKGSKNGFTKAEVEKMQRKIDDLEKQYNSYDEVVSNFVDGFILEMTKNIKTISLETLQIWFSNPDQYMTEINDLLTYYYIIDGDISQMYDLIFALPELNYTLKCYGDKSTYSQDIVKIRSILENVINHKQLTRQLLVQLAHDGTALGTWLGDKKNPYFNVFNNLQYVYPYGVYKGKMVGVYDLSYLDILSEEQRKAEYANLSPFVTKRKYDKWKNCKDYDKQKELQLIVLPPETSLIARNRTLSSNQRLGLPQGTQAMNDLLHKQKMKDLERSMADKIIRAIAVVKMRDKDDNDNKVKESIQKKVFNSVKRALEKNTSSSTGLTCIGLPSFASFEYPEFKNIDDILSPDKYESVNNDITSGTSISSVLTNGTGGNYASANLNLEMLYRKIDAMLEQIEEIYNQLITIVLGKSKGKKYRFEYIKGVPLSKKDKISNLKSLADKGYSIKPLLDNLGIDFEEYISQSMYEIEDLKLREKIIPPLNTNNISSKDNIGGRPTDDSNENNSTVTTKTNDGNSNPKPSTT